MIKIGYRSMLASAAAISFVLSPALASAAELHAMLKGAEETGGGDADGSGAFKAEVDPESGDLCYTLSADKVATPVAAHIHEGAAGTDGAPVITLGITGADNDDCVAVEPDLLKAILANPAGYYANVHTEDYPKGAVRGQLMAAH